VRYLLTNVDLPAGIPELPDLHLVKRLGPVRNSVGTPVYLYEITENNPVAWVAPVAVRAQPDQIRAAVLDPRLNLSSVALVDSTSKIPTKAVSVAPAPSDVLVSAAKYDPGHMVLELNKPASEGNVLVVSENWFPGWSAMVDGVATLTSRVDYTLIGVPLPAGARRVELTFKDPAYLKGRIITLIALVLTAALMAFGAAAARKSSAKAVRV
jgi:hypothetical protein